MPKISALPAMTTADGDDPAPIVDDSAGSTKKITLTKLKEWLQSLAGWITTAMIGDNQVTAVKLATTAVKIGQATVTSSVTPSGATETTIASVTVTVPSGGRDLLLMITAPQINPNDATRVKIDFKEGSTVLQRYYHVAQASGETFFTVISAPSAGSHTYIVTSTRDSGAGATQWYADAAGATIRLLAMMI